MKLLLLIGIGIGVGLFLLTCTTPSKLNQEMSEEFLIHTRYKIIDNGYFIFLQMEKSLPVKEITFIYNINKKKKFSVSLLRNKEVNSQYNIKYFKSSEEWNNKQLNSHREKYYKIISENFLNISNEAKFELLDSLAMSEK